MKDWVKPYVEQELRRRWKKIDQSVIEKELESKENLEYHLTREFYHSGLNSPVTEIFGSVLADLPEEAFMALGNKKEEFFFCLCQFPAEVKVFQPEKIPSDGRFYIVMLESQVQRWPLKAARGVIAHELAHLYKGHATSEGLLSKNYEEREDEADQIAVKWGFGDEIEALREYERAQEGETTRNHP